ncbi:MAG TPA: hypothetical protein VJV78_31680 [Polyangiales bacterium]|nr:hypothetical protein [Polyangiales bacterium]
MHHALTDGSLTLCSMLVLRSLPFAVFSGHAALARGARQHAAAQPHWVRALPIAICAVAWSALYALGRAEAAVWHALGLAYYALVSTAVPRASRLLQAGTITRGALLTGLCVVLLLVPGLALPGVAMATFLVVGWELVLRSYSYCVETAAAPTAERKLGPCLFFLLVDPTLLYTQRSRPCADTETRSLGLARLSLGVLAFVLSACAIASMAQWRTASESYNYVTQLLVVGALRFLSEYAAHSGLASVQIGLMRLIGWHAPERYDYPLLSTSPMDFWRRWNSYVRVWLEAYVFLPWSLAAARRTRSRLAQVGVALGTLLVCGCLHDLYILGGRQRIDLHFTGLFLAGGVVLGLWRLSSLLFARLPLRGRARMFVDAALPRMCMAAVFVVASLVWSQR